MNNFRKFAIFLFIIFGLLNLSSQIFFYSDYIHLIETYASSDNHISYPLTIVVGIDLLVFGIAILIYWIDWIDWNDFKFSNVNIIDKITISIILIFIILYHLKNQSDFLRLLFREDNFFENLTVIFALSTSILLAINLKKFHDRFSRLFLILCSLTFFYFGMEEISWGQNILKWETPQIIGELNYQNETNTHNYLNPYFTLVYILFNIVIASILLFSKRIKDTLVKYINENFKYLIPGNANLYYAIIFTFLIIQSYYTYGGELTEEVFSIFSLAYAINLSLQKKMAK